MICDPEKELKRICDFIGVEFTKEMFNVFLANTSFDNSGSKKGFRKEPVSRWKQHINPIYERLMRLILGKNIKKMGYIK